MGPNRGACYITASAKSWHGLVGEGEGGRAHPHSQTSPKHRTTAAFVVQTLCHHPCCPYPALVFPFVTSSNADVIAIGLSVPLYLMEAVLMNVLMLLALAIVCRPLCPYPSFRLAHGVFFSSWHVAHLAPLPSCCCCFTCSTCGSRYIT